MDSLEDGYRHGSYSGEGTSCGSLAWHVNHKARSAIALAIPQLRDTVGEEPEPLHNLSLTA